MTMYGLKHKLPPVEDIRNARVTAEILQKNAGKITDIRLEFMWHQRGTRGQRWHKMEIFSNLDEAPLKTIFDFFNDTYGKRYDVSMVVDPGREFLEKLAGVYSRDQVIEREKALLMKPKIEFNPLDTNDLKVGEETGSIRLRVYPKDGNDVVVAFSLSRSTPTITTFLGSVTKRT